MNMNRINTFRSDGVNDAVSNNTANQTTYEKGQVVEGLITKVSDKISINFSGQEVTVPKSTIQNAKEGETRKFEIMDVSKQSIVLKEVGNGTSDTKKINATWTNVETDKTALSDYQSRASLEKEKEEDIHSKKDILNDIENRMTDKDFRELMDEGISLETYELEQLERALERIKEQQLQKQSSIDNQITEIKTEDEKADEKIKYSKSGLSEKIADKLKESNLPVTDANIMRVATALELGSGITELSDQAKSYVIGTDLPLTIENVYKAQYTGSSSNIANHTVTDVEWNNIKDQVVAVLKDSGFESTKANLEQAKWLLNHNLPVTKESFDKLNELNKITDDIDQEELLDKIVTTIGKGNEAKNTLLENSYGNSANQVLNDIMTISDSAIVKTVKELKEVTIFNLKQAQNLINKEGKENRFDELINMKEASTKDLSDIDIKAITAKRQLEEIRLKMTLDASQKLIGKGINIETESLGTIVKNLKELEDNYYKSFLNESAATAETSQVDLLQETNQKINELKSSPNYILGFTLSNRHIVTIHDLHSEGINLKAKLDQANISYDTLMTSPRKDMGDSIEKAFQNVSNILDDLNLENTEANKRAVQILGYNHMDITAESVSNMKAYDSQLNALMRNLTPTVAVHLIQEEINPLNTPIEELNSQINEIKEEYGVTDEEKYSKYLWKLDKENGLTEEERKGYIGIYRLLHNIEKTNGAAIGSVVKTNQDMTLKNLLTAVRTRNSKGIDQVVDDNFGMLTDLHFSKETIHEQLDAAFHENNTKSAEDSSQNQVDYQVEHANLLLNHIMDVITPGKIDQIAKTEDIFQLSLEQLEERLSNLPEDEKSETEYNENEINKLRNLASNSDAAIKLLQEFQLSPTISNLFLANDYLNSKDHLFKKINDKLNDKIKNDKNIEIEEDDSNALSDEFDRFIDALDNKESMTSQYERFEESVTKILNKEYDSDTISAKDIATLRSLTDGVKFVKELSKKECYEIPIVMNGEITNVNLTIIDGQKDKGKIQVKVSSESIGMVEANFNIKGDSLKGTILCNSKDGLNQLKDNKESLKEALSITGINTIQLDYGINGQESNRYSKNNLFETEKAVNNFAISDEIITRNNSIDRIKPVEEEKSDLQTESTIKEENPNRADKSNEKISTNQLYRVSKKFILHIKMIDSSMRSER